MKKRTKWLITIAILIILLFPFSKAEDSNGNTQWTSLTYKVVHWNRTFLCETYERTALYLFPNNFKSLDTLWLKEIGNISGELTATVEEIGEEKIIVRQVNNNTLLFGETLITVDKDSITDWELQLGDVIQISYEGVIYEDGYLHLNATKCEPHRDFRSIEYNETWLDIENSEYYGIGTHILTITAIYKNCFFAYSVIPGPGYVYKINMELDEQWCIGDTVQVECENEYGDTKLFRMEADGIEIETTVWDPDPNVCYKPVIYFYPQTITEVNALLTLNGKLTCTYPQYENGWTVTAYPDGTLIDQKGQSYNYLYWEGETEMSFDFTQGYCVKGEDTAAFLEDALEQLGLNRKEANEFIVYWLPLMQNNAYNVISFQGQNYTDAAQLSISPNPDTMIRVFMAWYKTDNYVDIAPQQFIAIERKGFTVVEWGGTEVSK